MKTWKPVAGYEGIYEVSRFGKVRRACPGKRTRVGRVLKGSLTTSGYPQVSLFKNNKPRPFRVHRLVAAAFLGPCPEGKCVNHKNGVKTDARLSNLEYVTGYENFLHAVNVLGMTMARNTPRGDANIHTKLPDAAVAELRRLRAITDKHGGRGRLYAEFAERYGMHVVTIKMIATGAFRVSE